MSAQADCEMGDGLQRSEMGACGYGLSDRLLLNFMVSQNGHVVSVASGQPHPEETLAADISELPVSEPSNQSLTGEYEMPENAPEPSVNDFSTKSIPTHALPAENGTDTPSCSKKDIPMHRDKSIEEIAAEQEALRQVNMTCDSDQQKNAPESPVSDFDSKNVSTYTGTHKNGKKASSAFKNTSITHRGKSSDEVIREIQAKEPEKKDSVPGLAYYWRNEVGKHRKAGRGLPSLTQAADWATHNLADPQTPEIRRPNWRKWFD